MSYDAIVLISFGGPEKMDDVMPFLRNVLRGKNVPEERMHEVAHHYKSFGGKSPINDQNKALIAAIEEELKANGIDLPVYFGNRNWHPMLEDTMAQMRDDGVKKALGIVTSAFSCYSGCRQYKEDIKRCSEMVENAPHIDKVRLFYNHPGFIKANVDHVKEALASLPGESETAIAFTAHSIPVTMAKTAQYERQLMEVAEIIADKTGIKNWQLVFQSRSGPPHQPWLEPDICDHIESLNEKGVKELIIAPIGFISDHMEVIYDLDDEAKETCSELGMHMARAATAGTHPDFVKMFIDLIRERTEDEAPKAEGPSPAWGNQCPEGCCAYTPGRPKRP